MTDEQEKELRARVDAYLQKNARKGGMKHLVAKSGITRQSISAFRGGGVASTEDTLGKLQRAIDELAPDKPSSVLGGLILELEGLTQFLKADGPTDADKLYRFGSRIIDYYNGLGKFGVVMEDFPKATSGVHANSPKK